MKTDEYKISFFKPTTPRALKNRNLTVKLFLAWAIAIFGFQTLLKVLEKPVQEEALISFFSAWENIEADNTTSIDYQTAALSMIHASGKSTLTDSEYEVIMDGVGWILYQLTPEQDIAELQAVINEVTRLRGEITSLLDEDYLEAKEKVIMLAAPTLGIKTETLMSRLLATGLDGELGTLTAENREAIPGIMELYMTHNRSVLTDTIFLGFPFHYFYTAVFLLVFFIGLCWYYCYRTDKMHAEMNFTESTD